MQFQMYWLANQQDDTSSVLLKLIVSAKFARLN